MLLALPMEVEDAEVAAKSLAPNAEQIERFALEEGERLCRSLEGLVINVDLE